MKSYRLLSVFVVLAASTLLMPCIRAWATPVELRKSSHRPEAKADVASHEWKPQLALRKVTVPAALPQIGVTNPIDRLLLPYFKAHGIVSRPLVDDRTYARRVYLDIIGLLPAPVELQAFIADTNPNKRAALANRLLADERRYSEHWLTFWNDMLRNDYVGTGYIDGGRTQITDWLLNALRTNLPYDRFVAQLVNPTPESAGFVNGIVWRGRGQLQSDPANAGRAGHLAGVHGHQFEVRLLS